MKTRMLGILSLICLVLTTTWLALLIATMARSEPVETFEQALAFVARLDGLFYLTYINATLITLCATMLFAGFYIYFRPSAPEWSIIGLVFVPVYSALNLFSYLSQITIIPRLLAFQQMSEYRIASNLLLGQLIQQWPDSAVAFFNNLSYAILGFPSIIFGTLLVKQGAGSLKGRSKQIAGRLLALNGVFCFIGVIGLAMRNELLQWGSAAGGVLFLLALIPLTSTFLQE